QPDGVQFEPVPLGDGPADGRDDLVDLAFPLAEPLDLVDDDEPLLAPRLDGERRAPLRPERGAAPLDRPLDVVRVDVPAPDDDQVLQAAGDEQLAVAQEPEVARAEERLSAAAGQGRAEGLLRPPGIPPVAPGDAPPAHPDLADAVAGARRAG